MHLAASVDRLTRLALLAGALGPAQLTPVYLVAGAIRVGYDAGRNVAGALTLASWIDVTNLVLDGVLLAAFAFAALWTLTAGRRWAPKR
jgi:hypothetical protein